MTLNLAHICIVTTDLKKTEDFYTQALGCKKVFDFKKNNTLYGYYLQLSEKNYMEVFEDKEAKHQSSAFLHLCLETDDIDADIERLRANNIEFTEKAKGCDNTYQIWFKDPNGIDIELHQYTDDSSQLTGMDCQVDW